MILEIGGLVLFVAVALLLLMPIVRGAARQRVQGTWPRVQARVTEHRLRRQGNDGFREYRVQYEYGGVAHDRFVGVADGSRHHLLASSSAIKVERALRHRMANHPVGSLLPVMVNPANPDEAYFVERELPARLIAIVTTAILALFFAAFLLVAFA